MAQERQGKTTIFDVAERAGVSIKTVSRVVNREPNVRASTRRRVEQAIEALRYRPDRSARTLASQRSHLIGLVYDDPAAYELPSSSYIIRLQKGALRGCTDSGHELLIHPCNYRKRTVGAELKALIGDAQLAGVIVAAPLANMPRIVRPIQSTGTPFVRISPGHKVRGQLSVATNDRDSSAAMVDHLATLGHRRIAFISGHEAHAAVANRLDGYRDGLERNGLSFDPELVAAGDNSFQSGLEAGRTLLRRKRRPTAVFAANDDMAAGVLRAARRLRLRVPEDVSVAGFDDIVLARLLEPELTTVRQPLARMAEHAVAMLLQTRRNRVTGFECIPASLQVRGSTGPVPG